MDEKLSKLVTYPFDLGYKDKISVNAVRDLWLFVLANRMGPLRKETSAFIVGFVGEDKELIKSKEGRPIMPLKAYDGKELAKEHPFGFLEQLESGAILPVAPNYIAMPYNMSESDKQQWKSNMYHDMLTGLISLAESIENRPLEGNPNVAARVLADKLKAELIYLFRCHKFELDNLVLYTFDIMVVDMEMEVAPDFSETPGIKKAMPVGGLIPCKFISLGYSLVIQIPCVRLTATDVVEDPNKVSAMVFHPHNEKVGKADYDRSEGLFPLIYPNFKNLNPQPVNFTDYLKNI